MPNFYFKLASYQNFRISGRIGKYKLEKTVFLNNPFAFWPNKLVEAQFDYFYLAYRRCGLIVLIRTDK